MPVILTIVGLNRSGKSTAATHFERQLQRYELKTQRLSFAKPLKIIAETVGITKENRDELEEFSRVLKTQLGQDLFARTLIKDIDPSVDVVIIDDMRYIAEYNALLGQHPVIVVHNRRNPEKIDLSNSMLTDVDRLTVLMLHMMTHKPAELYSTADALKAHCLLQTLVIDIDRLNESAVEKPNVTLTEAQGMLVLTSPTTKYKIVAGPGVDVGDLHELVEKEIAPYWDRK